MPGPVLHHLAVGIHPGAFVQPDPPDTSQVQEGVLWIDTSTPAPYQIKVWNATEGAGWEPAGPATRLGDCLVLPGGQEICGDRPDVLRLLTPAAEHDLDAAGYQLPGGHRLEYYTPGADETPVITLPDPSFEGAGWQPQPGSPHYEGPGDPDSAPGVYGRVAGSAGITTLAGPLLIEGVPTSFSAGPVPDGTHFAYVVNDGAVRATFSCPRSGNWRFSLWQCYPIGGGAAANTGVQLRIDGVPLGDLVYGFTNNPYSDWHELFIAAVHLTQGTHQLELRGHVPNLAWLSGGYPPSRAVYLLDQLSVTWVPPADPDQRLRLVHASAGPQLDMPFDLAAETPSAILGQHPTTGLPVWAAAPSVTTQPPAPAVDVSSPDVAGSVRCGMAQALTTKLAGVYDQIATIVTWAVSTFVGYAATLLLNVVIDALTGPEASLFLVVADARLTVIVSSLIAEAVRGALPQLDAAAEQAVLQAAYCALSPAGGQVSVTDETLTTWSAKIGAASSGFVGIEQWALGELVGLIALAAWQSAAYQGGQSPSSACDGMVCA